MNKKGFTLFTALVSFVLILLSAMLVQTMIKAERDRTEVISNIEEQAEMQAMADLTRAEALQTFNYTIRKRMEEYFSNPTNTIEIYPQENNFQEIQEKFAERFFGAGGTGDQFINDMAVTITESMPSTKFIGPYEISVKFKGTGVTEQKEILFASLKELFKKSVEAGEFFEVVNCENGNPQDCLGTFYLNLDTSDLSEETYESFPQIKVHNPRTQRILQESIFPKGKIKIYVPIRLFKAIAEARSLALEYEKETGNSWKTNYGLFSPRIHNEIEEMKLGICDPSYCSLRTNPYVPPENKNMQIPCPNTTGFPVAEINYPSVKCTTDLLERGLCFDSSGNPVAVGRKILSYSPNTAPNTTEENLFDPNNQGKKISELAGKRLCKLIQENIATGDYLDFDSADDFILGQDDSYAFVCNLSDRKKVSMSIISTTRNSVKVDLQGAGSASLDPGFNRRYNANNNYGGTASCPQNSASNSLLWGTYGIGINADNKIIQKTKDSASCLGFPLGITPNYATCSEVSKIAIRIPFKETNKNYIIDKTNKPVYVIELIDDKFTPDSYTDAFHQTTRF